MNCKWMSDDGQEICCNGDCPFVADFCPWTELKGGCRYAEFKNETEVKRMNAKKCDRCGTLFEGGVVPDITIHKYTHGYGESRYDLCPKCQENLKYGWRSVSEMIVNKQSVLKWVEKELAKTQRNYDFSLKGNDTDRTENLAKKIGRWKFIIEAVKNYERSEQPKIFFLCDKRACENCVNPWVEAICYTQDITHAKNFEKVNRDYREIVGGGD